MNLFIRNMRLITLFIIVFMLIIANPYSGYAVEVKEDGPYYYESFASYKIPFQPINALSEQEAKSRDSYYVAYFDSNKKIVSFSKYLKGSLEFTDEYIYDSEGNIEQRKMVKSTGEVIVNSFDDKGKIITSDK